MLVLLALLLGSVLSAVHHAEVIAHRIGEPLGSIVLALAVTTIEVGLILSMMLTAGEEANALARDTVFAAVMIILNGMVGISLLMGALRHREQKFSLLGVNGALTILVAISVLAFILPNFTETIPGPVYSRKQLLFVAIVTLVLYATYIIVQNFRHKNDFLVQDETPDPTDHQSIPNNKTTFISSVMLLVCLLAVVFLAESLAPSLDALVEQFGAPPAVVGILIACITLLPEGLSALKAARQNRLQKSLNLSLGSAVASIGLTIPTVSFMSLYLQLPLTLGISNEATVLFLLSLFVIMLSLATGRTTILQGVVLLVVFAVYLFTVFVP